MKRVIQGLAAALAAGAGEHLPDRPPGRKTDKPQKPCLECKRPHRHNNSWCSARCCKLYRAKRKYGRVA